MADGRDLKYVTVEISKKMIDFEHPWKSEKNGKEYVRVMAPDRGVYFYPLASLKPSKNDENKVYFVRPEGTEIQVRYSRRREGVPDTAPNKEKYETSTAKITVEELKQKYDQERQVFTENRRAGNKEDSLYIDMTVPTEWGKLIESKKDGKMYAAVSISIQKDGNTTYYSFVLPQERFMKSYREEGMSYFGFPKHKNDGGDYMVKLQGSVRQPDGSYARQSMEVSSTQLKEYVEAAKNRNAAKDRFVGIDIPTSMFTKTESKEGKPLAIVYVPMPERNEVCKIIVPADRIQEKESSKSAYMSLYRKSTDGRDYSFKADYSVTDPGTGKTHIESMRMTSEKVIRNFQTAYETHLIKREEAKQQEEKKEQTQAAAAEDVQKTAQARPRRHGR